MCFYAEEFVQLFRRVVVVQCLLRAYLFWFQSQFLAQGSNDNRNGRVMIVKFNTIINTINRESTNNGK